MSCQGLVRVGPQAADRLDGRLLDFIGTQRLDTGVGKQVLDRQHVRGRLLDKPPPPSPEVAHRRLLLGIAIPLGLPWDRRVALGVDRLGDASAEYNSAIPGV
jgi:hypothetical protein